MDMNIPEVIMSFQQPLEGGYKGGVSTIVNSYMANKELFNNKGYDVNEYDPKISKKWGIIKNSKLRNIISAINQIIHLHDVIDKNRNIIFHIHTSREFLFLKDVILGSIVRRLYNNTKIAITIHVGDIETIFNRIHFFKKWCIKALNKSFDLVFCMSYTVQAQMILEGVQKEKLVVLYNFYDLACSRKEIKQNNGTLKLVFIGSIQREKGIIELLQALKLLDKTIDYHLDICGIVTDAAIKDQFESLVYNNDNISIKGYVDKSTKESILQSTDVLILPSYHEGLPLVILEALSAGCAIISTRVGATKEILSSKNSIWINIMDPVSIKNSIELLYNNKNLLSYLKYNNMVLSKQFTIEKHIHSLCAEYDSLYN